MSEETIKIGIDTLNYYKNKKTASELEEVPIDILRCMYLDLLHNVEQLEKENISKQKAYDDCYCEFKHYKQFDSIPKSVIRDKIEELEKEIKDYQCEKNKINLYQRKILKEILGDE